MKLFSLISVLFFLVTANADLQVELTSPSQHLQTQSSRHYYNFGQVSVNSMNTVMYTVTNTGTAFLQFSTASVWGMNYDSNHTCTLGLNPYQRCQFQIRYWPFNLGLHTGQFEIRFYGATPMPESIRVDLWGEAVQR